MGARTPIAASTDANVWTIHAAKRISICIHLCFMFHVSLRLLPRCAALSTHLAGPCGWQMFVTRPVPIPDITKKKDARTYIYWCIEWNSKLRSRCWVGGSLEGTVTTTVVDITGFMFANHKLFCTVLDTTEHRLLESPQLSNPSHFRDVSADTQESTF